MPPMLKKRIFLKENILKKYKIFKKSEKERATPSYSEYLKIGMESQGEKLRKEKERKKERKRKQERKKERKKERNPTPL